MRHLDGLHAFALRLGRDPATAERLVADATSRARAWWEHFQLGTDVRVWLFTLLFAQWRTARRPSDASVPDDDIGGEAAPATSLDGVAELDPEGRVYDAVADEELVVTLDSLPDAYRVQLLLSDVHHFSYAEAAEVLGLPEGTMRERLHRGRDLLQKRLVGYAVAMGRLELPARPPG